MNKTVTKTITIGEALPKEIERCQEILADYASIGAAGLFGSTIIKQRLAEANAIGEARADNASPPHDQTF
jgi:hypothetical protein